MNSKNVKVVDDHNIDRNANIMFAFDLEGSEYVAYWIERDETQNNIFVSKTIKNLDSTFNLLDIDDSMEKEKISEIVKSLIMTAVNSDNDKLVGDSITLSDGKVVKLMTVSFNKEQRVNVKKSYVTTVKKEVTKVAGVYYDVVLTMDTLKTVEEEIFPSVMPVVPEETAPVIEPAIVERPVESIAVAQPTVEKVVESVPSAIPTPVDPVSQDLSAPIETAPVLSMPVVEVAKDASSDNFVAFGTELTTEDIPQEVSVTPAVSVVSQPEVVESITTSQPTVEKVVESVPSAIPTPVDSVQPLSSVEPPVQITVPDSKQKTVESPAETIVTPVPPVVEVSTPANDVSQPFMFTMDKETNLKNALGEAANSQTIPVENIQQVREFGVDDPVKTAAPVPQQTVAPVVQAEASSTPKTTAAAGFANSKFFMVVAVAFFLASCVFLGYEVFHYFQLTK